MIGLARAIWFTIVLMFGVGLSAQANAQISAELAKKCRALMVKAFPTELYGSKGNAAAQRKYFQSCINNKGNMPEDAQKPDGPAPNQKGYRD